MRGDRRAQMQSWNDAVDGPCGQTRHVSGVAGVAGVYPGLDGFKEPRYGVNRRLHVGHVYALGSIPQMRLAMPI